MIVRNVNDKEVLETTYLAHGGVAQMILTAGRFGDRILAIARLAPGKPSKPMWIRWKKSTSSSLEKEK
jgi:hypothetical protein